MGANFTKGVGRLAADRYDFQDHIDGTKFAHEASAIKIDPAIMISGDLKSNVRDAIQKLKEVVETPIDKATELSPGIIQLSGDIYNLWNNVKVKGLRGYPISNTAPVSGDSLVYDGSSYVPTPLLGFTAGGDLIGTNTNQQVVSITGSSNVKYGIGGQNFTLLRDVVSTISYSGKSTTIEAENVSGDSSDGGQLFLKSGYGTGTDSNGGYLNITSGDGGSIGASEGGYINIKTGSGFNNGGSINIETGGGSSSGSLSIFTGDNLLSGISGDILIKSGDSYGLSGTLSIKTGNSSNGAGGNLSITSGNSVGAQGSSITITSGNSDVDVGGDINILAGESNVDSGGNVYIQAGNSSSYFGGNLYLNSGTGSGFNGNGTIEFGVNNNNFAKLYNQDSSGTAGLEFDKSCLKNVSISHESPSIGENRDGYHMTISSQQGSSSSYRSGDLLFGTGSYQYMRLNSTTTSGITELSLFNDTFSILDSDLGNVVGFICEPSDTSGKSRSIYLKASTNTSTSTSDKGGDVIITPGAGEGDSNNNWGNIVLGGISATPTAGFGSKTIFIANCTATPSASPSGGGILYVESGSLKYKGSSGTITTIAPA